MLARVMITDGGPHPASKWAVMTASQIIQIEGIATDAQELEKKIVSVLEAEHATVQLYERRKLKDKTYRKAPIDPSPYIDQAFNAVIQQADGTRFETHFAKPDVQEYIRTVLGNHFATSMDIERGWHASRKQNRK